MKTLALRLEGVLQSWGDKSRFKERGTGSVPTKSGVVGLLACALGIPRGQDMTFLNQLFMTVRVDKPGRIYADFQSAAHFGDKTPHNPMNLTDREFAAARSENQIGHRYYLQEASFLVLLEGEDELVDQCAQALAHPKWALFLGRRNCVPSRPVLLGTFSESAEELIDSLEFPEGKTSCHAVRDTSPQERGQMVSDLLLNSSPVQRTFGYREVVEFTVNSRSHDPFELVDMTGGADVSQSS